MNTLVFQKVVELHNAGYSAEEISSKLEISRATAYRAIQQHETSLAMGGLDEPEDEYPSEYTEDDEDVSTLAGLGKAVAVIEQEAKIKTKKLQRDALKSFHRILEGLKEHTSGSTWSRDDIRKVLTETNNVIDLVEEACAFEKNEYQDLSIFLITTIIKDHFKIYLANFSEGLKIQWDQPNMDMLEAGLEAETFQDQTFDEQDYERQKAWLIFNDFIDSVLKVSGVLNVDQVDELSSELKWIREALDEDLPAYLDGEFDEELELLDQLQEFLKEYRIRTEEAIFGKRFSLPDTLLAKIKSIQIQNEE